MRALAVIGAGFGDEGKGASVDALAHRALGEGRRPVVIRASGGAQAAHTVEAPAGRHVFGHLGSGVLAGEAGAPTWFGPRFVHNPPLFLRERAALMRLGRMPEASGDPEGAVTLPVDVAANQAAERARGDERHGSCGIGFGEAVGRSERAEDRVTLGDLSGEGDLLGRIVEISRRHAERRIAELGLDGEAAFVRRAADPAFLEAWLEDARAFAALVPPRAASDLPARFDTALFEGAQGLLLDRDAAFFPHVTRSRTGLANVAELVPALGAREIEAIYVTRAYATRHGAGPLPGEGLREGAAALSFADATNRPNAYQGALRFAPLCTSLVGGAIAQDIAGAGVPVRPRLAVTCLDQTDGDGLVLRDGAIARIRAADLPAALGCGVGWPEPWLAHGPSRAARADHAAVRAAA